MLKAIIIGSPGAGKSTFARKLRDITNLPLYYLDMLWHKPDGTNISREEFDLQLGEILKKRRWIIDGNYRRTLETRLKECHTVFLLDFPLEVCLLGAKSRIGKSGKIYPGWKRNLMRNSGSGSWTFPKTSCRRFMSCWRNIKRIKMLLSSNQEKKRMIIGSFTKTAVRY